MVLKTRLGTSKESQNQESPGIFQANSSVKDVAIPSGEIFYRPNQEMVLSEYPEAILARGGWVTQKGREADCRLQQGIVAIVVYREGRPLLNLMKNILRPRGCLANLRIQEELLNGDPAAGVREKVEATVGM